LFINFETLLGPQSTKKNPLAVDPDLKNKNLLQTFLCDLEQILKQTGGSLNIAIQ
jgi:hypothetical protein